MITLGALSIVIIDKSKSNAKFLSYAMIVVVLIIAIFGFFLYMILIPNFKAVINEGYLHETVNEIIEGKITDQEKVGALLEWFDRNSNNMYNIWFLNNRGKTSKIPFIKAYIVSEPPHICMRCYDDTDGRWVLTSRCGACEEYSKLFKAIMADALGFDVMSVYADGEDHVWNEVKIAGNWIPVDPTNVSLPNDSNGWEHYGFFEWKEGNASLVWAEFLNNDTILDRTHKYTNLTNVTLYCIDESNKSVSDVTITIFSNNLRRDPNRETFIKGQSKPKTNESGHCTFQIGGGNYTFRAESRNGKLTGEKKWVKFSDEISEHHFIIEMKMK